jgi:hypothetical protein
MSGAAAEDARGPKVPPLAVRDPMAVSGPGEEPDDPPLDDYDESLALLEEQVLDNGTLRLRTAKGWLSTKTSAGVQIVKAITDTDSDSSSSSDDDSDSASSDGELDLDAMLGGGASAMLGEDAKEQPTEEPVEEAEEGEQQQEEPEVWLQSWPEGVPLPDDAEQDADSDGAVKVT